jgi:hypothetical protein
MARSRSVKVIGAGGRISLGKQFAGRTVLVEQIEEGVWLLRIARVIPDSELWMHTEPAKTRVDQAIAWADENPPRESDLEALGDKVRDSTSQETMLVKHHAAF